MLKECGGNGSDVSRKEWNEEKGWNGWGQDSDSTLAQHELYKFQRKVVDMRVCEEESVESYSRLSPIPLELRHLCLSHETAA